MSFYKSNINTCKIVFFTLFSVSRTENVVFYSRINLNERTSLVVKNEKKNFIRDRVNLIKLFKNIFFFVKRYNKRRALNTYIHPICNIMLHRWNLLSRTMDEIK